MRRGDGIVKARHRFAIRFSRIRFAGTGAPFALALAALLALGASSALAAIDANQASAAECPNEALRAENGSLVLPDCRAYEQVSPSFKPVALVPA
jgi:hypothetical protein